MDTPAPTNNSQLRKKLNTVMGSDRFRLRRELQQLERKHDEARAQRLLEKMEASQQRRALRIQNKPQPDYPDDLPVAQRRE
ncbi:MAG TPA: hypothetical protein PLM98_16455, partial [Thiolinea sp.]|nr:hypothetical protein [Thiolinea sp.]